MGARSGLALKFLQWFVRGIQFLCAALVLGVYSYFLAALNDRSLPISNDIKAVEGIAGGAVLYTIIGLLLLCCCAGLAFASLIAMVLDVAFIGAFIYVAVANRNGAGNCEGYLDTPFGEGFAGETAESDDDGIFGLPSYRTSCRLQSAVFAVSIVLIVFFCFSILMELALVRHHRKEKRFGPSPRNNYTSGSGMAGSFFSRVMRRGGSARSRKPEDENALPQHPQPDQMTEAGDAGRGSYATETTAVNPAGYASNPTGYTAGYAAANPNVNKYDHLGNPPQGQQNLQPQHQHQQAGLVNNISGRNSPEYTQPDTGYGYGYNNAAAATPPHIGTAYSRF